MVCWRPCRCWRLLPFPLKIPISYKSLLHSSHTSKRVKEKKRERKRMKRETFSLFSLISFRIHVKQTMNCCGQLLLSLISNILDYSKLSSHEVVCSKSLISLSDSIETAVLVARQLASTKGNKKDTNMTHTFNIFLFVL